MLMIDPKMVELSGYKQLPHLMHPVVTDMRKAEAILAWAVRQDGRALRSYSPAPACGTSASTTSSAMKSCMDRIQPEDDEERKQIPRHLPYIVIVADEMADLMMTAGKEVEQHIIRLAQKSRAVGIHLILATQKPTVDVITGLIKSNLPARIAFQVASRTDSRVVLDEMGADKLLGNGDMLFLSPGTSTHAPRPGHVRLATTRSTASSTSSASTRRSSPASWCSSRRRTNRRRTGSGSGNFKKPRRAVRGGRRDRHPRRPRQRARCCSERSASATAGPPG